MTFPRLRAAVVASAPLFGLVPIGAQDLLKVDFNHSASPTETGFSGQNSSGVTHSTTAGDITVSYSGQQGTFDRGASGGTNNNFYRDFIFDNNGGTPDITLSLTGPGIAASADYVLTFYAYDSGDSSRRTGFSGISDTIGTTLGPVVSQGTGVPDSLEEYAVTGTFTSDSSGNLTFGINGLPNGTERTVVNGFTIVAVGGGDSTPPTLIPADIVDDQSGGSVNTNSLVTYTLTFSEDMDDSTVEATDFGDAGSDVSITIGAITETTPGVFTVEVTPTSTGTLELQVNASANLRDAAGNDLDTNASIIDDTSITVNAAPLDSTPPTLASTDMVDDQSGGPVEVNMPILYTVTFSEDIDAGTVDATDFGDAGGDVSLTIGSIVETSPGVFTVGVTPTSIGILELQIISGAVITDTTGNQLNTSSAITDDTSLTVAALSSTSLLSVDFNSGTGTTEPGFTAQTSYSETHSTSAGDITVAISDNPQDFFYFASTGTNTGLFDDFIFDNSGPMTLTLSGIGISPNTDYELTIWSFYGAEARSTTVTPTPGTTGTPLGPIAFVNPPTSLSTNAETGTFTSDGSGSLTFSLGASRPAINGLRIATIGPDATPPSILPANIVDDQGSADVAENTLVTYTLTFSEDIDHTSVSAADLGNAGSSPVTFGAVTETTAGVFSVEVTPTGTGTLQLQIPIGATILDTAGLSMDTAAATLDDTTLNVVVAPPDNTTPTPNPMTFAVVPYASSETSIAMEASIATDDAGVEYYFDETSGNAGGDDSGWQSSPVYEDTGLTTGLSYTYTVTARDLSSNQNATSSSGPESATAQTPIVPPAITAPTSRHIVQRNSSNVGTIEVEGTYSVGTPDEIEARAVVMPGTEDNGVTTAWQTIDAAPAGGTFAGSLTNVPAGGWYQLEVRSVISSTPSNAAVLEKVGVGDIYVTAGQSNSANFAAGYTLQSDRVSARSSTTESNWVLATHPLPIANGGSGTVWTVLGDKLIDVEDVPIGFVSCGQGGSTAASWTAGGGNYNSRLKPSVESFPVNGFKAALWHQGETDSIQGISAATHSGYLNGMISQSRTDAGWTIPWYLAEVSFHGSSNITKQEPIAAGQRLSIHADPLVFFGPSTDELHLTGGGSLHFNAVGNEAHAQGWADILLGSIAITPENGSFEDLGWIQYAAPNDTSPTPLTDGASTILDIVSTGQQMRVLDWRILAASGVAAADGSNGFLNPTTGTYAVAVDTVNGGVLPNMDGKHVAVLDGGSAGNYFLHSTRFSAAADTTYTLTVALGVRDDPASFGTARLEIMANGTIVATGTFDKATLDTLHGGDSSGTFTDASVSWTTGSSVPANQPLAVRIIKEGGAGTLLDFDNVRLSGENPNNFEAWIAGFGLDPEDQGFDDDPDLDGLANGIEAWFGTHPGQFSQGLGAISTDGSTTTFTHPTNANVPTDASGGFYEWCLDLDSWHESGSGPGGGPTVTLSPVTVGTTTTVTATSSEPIPRVFIRAQVTQD